MTVLIGHDVLAVVQKNKLVHIFGNHTLPEKYFKLYWVSFAMNWKEELFLYNYKIFLCVS